jgi:hypothetical protein
VRRARRRPAASALVVIAVAAAVVVVGSLLGIAAVTEDRAMQAALTALPPDERAVVVNRNTPMADDPAGADARARAALEALALYGQPLVAATFFQLPFGTVVIALDDLPSVASPIAGRLPAPCDGGATCEAAVVRVFDDEQEWSDAGVGPDLGSIGLTTVGNLAFSAELPIDAAAVRGQVYAIAGVAPATVSTATADIPRTSFWAVPLDPRLARAWTVDDILARATSAQRSLVAADGAFVIQSPSEAIADVRAKSSAASGRLLLIGSLTTAVLLAFAAFAAAVGRADVGQEYRRLRARGASRRQLAAFVTAEACIPALLGCGLGIAIALGIVAGLGAGQEAPVGDVVATALLSWPAAATIGVVVVAAIVAVILGIHPASGRLVRPSTLVVAALPLVIFVALDLATAGPTGTSGLASRAGGPALVLLPAVVGFLALLAALVVLPPIFRILARLARRARLPLRLALVDIAREPHRPAAILALLIAGAGAATFGLAYAETLGQGARDQAAFEAGMDVRVRELDLNGSFAGNSLPLERYEALGDDLGIVPVVRTEGLTVDRTGVAILGIDATALPSLRGWRVDMADRPIRELADAIAMPGDWALRGHRLPAGDTISVAVHADGAPVRLSAIVRRDDGLILFVLLGDVVDGQQVMTAPLYTDSFGSPADPGLGGSMRGHTLVALSVGNGGPAAAIGPASGVRQLADLTFADIPEVVSGTVSIEVSGATGDQLIRRPQPADGVVLPALVSPSVAEKADARGVTVLDVDGSRLQVRVTGIIRSFPTMTDPESPVAVFDRAALASALDADSPGRGVPTEVLIRAADDARAAEVAAAVSGDPFRPAMIVERSALVAERSGDAFADGVVWALLVAAFAGLALGIAGVGLGVAADLADEDGGLAELERHGLEPGAVGRLVVLRVLLLAGTGAAIGLLAGAALALTLSGVVAVSADAATPVPSLLPVIPWGATAALIGSLVAIVVAIAALLAGRRLSGSSLAEERS